jgi:uncharacterized protein YjbI with pentapeptide repeats
MAVTRSTRFKLTRWDQGSDPVNRSQADLDNLQVETLAALFREGDDANKGVASDAAYVKSFYNAPDTGILYYSNGSTWMPLNDYGEAADIAALTVGSTAAAGVSNEIARADHVHTLAAPASTPANIGTVASIGSATTPARSDHVHVLGTAIVGTATLVDASVTTAKILDANVTSAKLADASVTTAKIVDANVTTAKILDGNVTPLKIGSTLAGNGLQRDGITGIITVKAGTGITVDASGVSLTGGISSAQIADASVTTAKIADANVTEVKIATAAVTPLKIGATLAGNGITRDSGTGVLSVNPTSGGGLAVSATGVSVATSGVLTAMIADANVTAAKLATDSVTSVKILASAVTPLKIDSTIVGSGVSAGGLQRSGTGVLSALPDSTTITVNASGQLGLVTGGVANTHLATNSVATTNIQTSAVTPLKIDSTIVGTGITAGGLQRSGTGVLSALPDGATVTVNGSGQIAVGTITNSNIADSTISPLKLTTAVASNGLSRNGTTGALSVVAAASGGLSVSASGVSIGDLSVTQAMLNTNSVANAKIVDGAVTGAKAGAGVYRNVNSLATGGQIVFTTVASLPADGATATGYTNGDIMFGY